MTEYRYDSAGLRTAAIEYRGAFYVSGVGVASSYITLSDIQAAGGPDLIPADPISLVLPRKLVDGTAARLAGVHRAGERVPRTAVMA
ncbi:MAG: hypothetical protein QM767_02920 [Anaeromyxobacter sp.]